ncbi:MAG: XTP/dITP diphosphatase [bacterium]
MKLVIATKNPGKLAEIKELVQGLDFELQTLVNYPNIGDIPETGNTFIENATIKATTVAQLTGCLTLADDSGLEVLALHNRPGVMSARYAKTDQERNLKLLEEMKDVAIENRQARFVCAIAIATPDGILESVQETCEGIIAFKPNGNHGFGFDPVFYYPPLNKTFAELTREEKASVSHRGKALYKAKQLLAKMVMQNKIIR